MIHYGREMLHWNWFIGRFNFFWALVNVLIVLLIIAAIRWLWIKGNQEKKVSRKK